MCHGNSLTTVNNYKYSFLKETLTVEDVKAVMDFFPSNNSFYSIPALEKTPVWKNECVQINVELSTHVLFLP